MKIKDLLLFSLCISLLFFLKWEERAAISKAAEGTLTAFHLEKWVASLYEQGKKGKAISSKGQHHISWEPQRKREKVIPLKTRAGAVTFDLSGGRLGDNLLSFLHAKWLSYRYQLPLYLTPFPQVDEFALSKEEKIAPFFEQKTVLQREGELAQINTPLLVVPYFPEPSMKNQSPLFAVDWEDPDFKKEILRSLTPTQPHQLISLPKDRITIGVHVRRGGGVDNGAVRWEYPLKFPTDAYYLEQIRRVANIFQGEPLYVFLLTDDAEPEKLVENYKKAIPLSHIEWGCRPNTDIAVEHIVDDFFSIPLFDCLILCDSNFSIVASKLSEYAIKIAPTHYWRKKGKVGISQVELEFNPKYKKSTDS